MTWYDDGNEGQVMRELLDRFEAENPGIRSSWTPCRTPPASSSRCRCSSPPARAPTSRGSPTSAACRSTSSTCALPRRPGYWEANFGPFLDWMRPAGSDAIPGFMTQLTVTGPFINRTLFDQAGIEVPEGETTWEEWAEVTRRVAEATGTPYAMVMDRTGHRLAGPAISQGAQIFDDEGFPKVDDAGHAPR
jgi:alpha-1,4-digalacturonate transport system substrate-binding protein